MANGEWLTQLLSGLGGAFTGEVAARSRIAEEQETQRKLQEQQAEKDRLKRIQTLRQQPFSKEVVSQLLEAGDTPANIASYGTLSKSFMPKEPEYSNKIVGPKGEVYFAEPGTGRSIRAMGPDGKPLFERVPTEREPSGPTPLQLQSAARSDLRMAQGQEREAETAYRLLTGAEPKLSDFKIAGPVADTAGFLRKKKGWEAETTYAGERRRTARQEVQDAQRELRRAMGLPDTDVAAPAGGAAGGAPVRASAALQQQIANDLRDKIAQIIRAPELSPEQKQAMIRQANEKAAAFLRQ
jgi:hypothetical protein